MVDERREHERLELALEAAQLGTWNWDEETGRTLWDARLEAMHGMAPGTFGGTFEDWKASIHPDDRAECVARVTRRDGRPRALRAAAPLRSGPTARSTGSRDVVGSSPTRRVTRWAAWGWSSTSPSARNGQTALARRIAEDHQLIQSVQRALLPVRMPQVDGIEFAARYEAAPGSAIGGDWYAFVPLRGGRLGVAIGDVAGHGLSAVAEMAHVRFSLRSLAYLHDDPTDVLSELSELVRVFSPDTMVTALYGTLDPQSGWFEYAIAGHFPPALCGPDSCDLVEVRADPPLGLGQEYARHTLSLGRDQTLIAFTDGILERRSESISLSLQRLAATCAPGPRQPDALCEHLMHEMLVDLPNDDDAAIVAVRLAP